MSFAFARCMRHRSPSAGERYSNMRFLVSSGVSSSPLSPASIRAAASNRTSSCLALMSHLREMSPIPPSMRSSLSRSPASSADCMSRRRRSSAFRPSTRSSMAMSFSFCSRMMRLASRSSPMHEWNERLDGGRSLVLIFLKMDSSAGMLSIKRCDGYIYF